MLKLFKTTSPNKLFDYDCVTLYIQELFRNTCFISTERYFVFDKCVYISSFTSGNDIISEGLIVAFSPCNIAVIYVIIYVPLCRL